MEVAHLDAECLGQAGHDYILRTSGFEDFQDRIETKTGIRPHTQLSKVWWYVYETRCQQFNAAIPCASIAWPQFGIPPIGGAGFQAHRRIAGTLAPITGTVADLRLLLTPLQRDHTTVEIEDQAGAVVWPVEKLCSSRSFTRCIRSKHESGAWCKKRRNVCGSGKPGSPVRYWKAPLKRKNDAVSKRTKPNTMG